MVESVVNSWIEERKELVALTIASAKQDKRVGWEARVTWFGQLLSLLEQTFAMIEEEDVQELVGVRNQLQEVILERVKDIDLGDFDSLMSGIEEQIGHFATSLRMHLLNKEGEHKNETNAEWAWHQMSMDLFGIERSLSVLGLGQSHGFRSRVGEVVGFRILDEIFEAIHFAMARNDVDVDALFERLEFLATARWQNVLAKRDLFLMWKLLRVDTLKMLRKMHNTNGEFA